MQDNDKTMATHTLGDVVAEMELFESTKTAPHWQQIKAWKQSLEAIAADRGDSRAGFEKWYKDKYPEFACMGIDLSGEYYSRRVNTAWEAWQAAQSRAGVVTDERPTLRVIAKRNLESLIKAVVNDDHHKKTMLSCLEELS